MKVTIHEVARQAGVSTKTVSRVINDQAEISEATRERVRAAISELGYRPNILARSLVSRRSHMLGIAAWGIENYAPSRLVVGVEQKANELGYSLFLNLVPHPSDDGAERILDTFVDHRVDGIIWVVPEVINNRDWLESVQMEALPPIVFTTMGARSGCTSISIDNRRGGFLATRHLLEQGCEDIGLIRGPAGWWEAAERARGWCEALEEAGLPARLDRVVESDWSARGGAEAMQTLLRRAPNLDAVFASSDQIALGALNAITRTGRDVPKDMALVGFDDIPEAAYFQPALTTVHHPLLEVGKLAVEHLHRMILARQSNEETYEHTSILQEPTLVIRASSLKNKDLIKTELSIPQ